AEVQSRTVPVSALSTRLTLEDGLLRLDPLRLDAAGGRLQGTVAMDASSDPISTDAVLRVRDLQLPRLFPDSELAEHSMGTIVAELARSGQGNSIAAMLGSADGEVAAAMGRGQVSNLVLELAGLDIAEALGILLTEDRSVPVRCAFADFAVDDGVMQARALVFDTTDTI